jgi:hypothetical protein
MKKILLIILCLYTINSFAQECGKTETGISTHPETPFNDDNCTLNNFDWRTATYNAPYYMGTATTNGQITSPFYNSDNTAIPELWNTFDYDAHDMLPEDGWELIINGITQAAPNTSNHSREIAFLVLYNKFTATLRVLAAHHSIGSNDYMAVHLKFAPNTNGQITGVLYPTQQIAQPLDDASINRVHANAKISAISSVGGGALYFFYADFPMGYDPCTCIFDEGTLSVNFEAIDMQTLDIYGRSWAIDNDLAHITSGTNNSSNDYLTNVYSSGGTNSQAGSLIFNSWGEMVTHYGSQKAVASKLSEQYKAYENLKNVLDFGAIAIDLAGNTSISYGDTSKFKIKDIKNPLKVASKFVEVLGAPLKKKRDAAVGAASATGRVRMIQSEMTMTGTLSNSTPKDGFTFLLPGRMDNENKCSDPNLGHLYPLYDEVLGRFALLETPKIEVKQSMPSFGGGGVYLGFDFDPNSFKYLFNPAAQIDAQNTLIYGAFVVKNKNGDAASLQTINLEKIESLSNEGTSIHISPFLPIECLGQLLPLLQLKNGAEFLDVQLRLIIFYEFNALNSEGLKAQAFEVLTYPLAKTYKQEIVVLPYPYEHIEHKLELTTSNYTSSQTIFAWDTIIINGDLTTTSGTEVRIIAPEIFMNSGSLGQGITLINDEFPISCSPLSPFDVNELSTFCKSENYQGNKNQNKNTKLIDDTPIKEKPQKSIIFQSSPNPFTNSFNVEFELETEGETSLIIYDALGRVVETVIVNTTLSIGKHQYQIDGTRLESGLYYATLQTANGTQTIKIIKQ